MSAVRNASLAAPQKAEAETQQQSMNHNHLNSLGSFDNGHTHGNSLNKLGCFENGHYLDHRWCGVVDNGHYLQRSLCDPRPRERLLPPVLRPWRGGC